MTSSLQKIQKTRPHRPLSKRRIPGARAVIEEDARTGRCCCYPACLLCISAAMSILRCMLGGAIVKEEPPP